MSTTVKYNGSTIATLTNQKKKLNTNQKWLTDDIEIEDITYGIGNVTQDSNGYLIFDDDAYLGKSYDLKAICDRQYVFDSITDLVLTCQTLMPYSFRGCPCTSLSSVTLTAFNDGYNNGGYVFANCTNLESINLPNFLSISSGGYQFAYCTKLTDVYMPLPETGQHMFDGCTSLVRIVIPVLGKPTGAQLNSYGFANCTKLEKVDLGNVTKINTNEFSGSTKFNTLVLRRTSAITALANVNAFNNTCFKSGGTGGTIYVPNDLISTYQTATNWSTIHGYGTITWVALEDSIYENTYVDGRTVALS